MHSARPAAVARSSAARICLGPSGPPGRATTVVCTPLPCAALCATQTASHTVTAPSCYGAEGCAQRLAFGGLHAARLPPSASCPQAGPQLPYGQRSARRSASHNATAPLPPRCGWSSTAPGDSAQLGCPRQAPPQAPHYRRRIGSALRYATGESHSDSPAPAPMLWGVRTAQGLPVASGRPRAAWLPASASCPPFPCGPPSALRGRRDTRSR